MSGLRGRDRGFSFIELLAYMAIAALLILAAVPQFENYRARAHDSNVRNDIRNLATMLESQDVNSPGQPQQSLAQMVAGARSFSVTKSSYANVHNIGMAICRNTVGYAVIAESKSGRVYGFSSLRGIVERLPQTEVSLNDSCGPLGIANTSAGYSGAYVHTYADWVPAAK